MGTNDQVRPFPSSTPGTTSCTRATNAVALGTPTRPPTEPIGLDDAPRGYEEFDKGAATKYVLNPNGLIPAA